MLTKGLVLKWLLSGVELQWSLREQRG